MEFRPTLPRDDLHGRFATSALGFAIPINVGPDAEVAVTVRNKTRSSSLWF